MPVRVILIASGTIAILVGLFYLFFTTAAVQSFDLGEPVLLARHFTRATGAAVLAIGVINILSVGDRGSRALRAVFVGNIVVHVFSIYTDFAESFSRNTTLWLTFALHVVIIAAFGYLLVTRTRQTAS